MEATVHSRGYTAQKRFVIDDESKVGEARRAAQALAGFELTAEHAGKIAIVATELANNLLRHAGGGELLVQCLGAESCTEIELLAIDRGPGMTDVARCMTDGFSTAGTTGTGLGAVRRLCDDFDIWSTPGEGTVVMARFGKPGALRYGAVSVALEGEIDCGDAWHLLQDQGVIALLVADGLGHGTFAAEASSAAVKAFTAAPFGPPQDTMMRAHGMMSKTRGGAAACALVEGDRVLYSGIGNISGSIVAPEKSTGMVSTNGTLGMGQQRARQFAYTMERKSLLVMHSDGVSARWELKNRPALMNAHPAIIAGVLYREHGRSRDDATIVVVAP